MSVSRLSYQISEPVDDAELSSLHRSAFGGGSDDVAWGERLTRHSLFWVTAREGAVLVGFVNVLGDGGEHAIIMDTCVDPAQQGKGVGAALIRHVAREAAGRGCSWLHADYEPHLVNFYETACGMQPTAAGLLRLR